MCDGPGSHSPNLTYYTTNVPGGRLAWLSLYSPYTLMAFLIILCYVCFLNDLIDTIASVRNPSCLFLFLSFSPYFLFTGFVFWFC